MALSENSDSELCRPDFNIDDLARGGGTPLSPTFIVDSHVKRTGLPLTKIETQRSQKSKVAKVKL